MEDFVGRATGIQTAITGKTIIQNAVERLCPEEKTRHVVEGMHFVNLPPDIYQKIQSERNEVRRRIANLIDLKSKSKRQKPITEFQKSALQLMLDTNDLGQALTKEGACVLLEVPPEEIPNQSQEIQKMLTNIGQTTISVNSVLTFTKKSSKTDPTFRNAYYFTARNADIPEITKEDGFVEPIRKLTDEEWDMLAVVLEEAEMRTSRKSHILREIFGALAEAAELGKAVTKEYVRGRASKILKREIKPANLEQSIAYAQIDLGEKFREMGFELIDKNGVIQAVLSKDLDDYDDDFSTYEREMTDDIKENIRIRIEDSLRHLDCDNRHLPVREILFYILKHKGCTIAEIMKNLNPKKVEKADEDELITPEKMHAFIITVRKLNELCENHSPLGINLYGTDRLHIGLSKKPYVPAVGNYNYHLESQESSLYPQPYNIHFNYSFFRKILLNKTPHLILADSDKGLLTRTIAAYSAFNFRISSSIIGALIKKLNPRTNKATITVSLNELMDEINREFSEHGVVMKRDQKGYYFETNVGSNGATKPTKWHDYYFSEDFLWPQEALSGHETKLRINSAKPVDQNLLSQVMEMRNALPYPFPETKDSYGAIPLTEDRQIPSGMKEQLVREACNLAKGSITRKSNSKMPDLKQAILLQMVISTLRGQAMLPQQLAKSIGVDERKETKPFARTFNELRQIIRGSGNTPIGIKSIELPTKVDGQNAAYYLGFKENV